ncbi:MAG: hypothetical protein MJZ98_06535 [Paludibacteraceae bacterium]|nr:hypothetical protein [Paludibacteraceae bacterium]
MRTKRLYVLLLAAMMGLFANSIVAQVTQYPYFCGFEVTAENNAWSFVNHAGSQTSWSVGTAQARNAGGNGMYVSNDNGTTAAYSATQSAVVVAYREFTLPAGHRYAFTFDWKGRGDNAINDYMTVCLVDNPTVQLTGGNTVPAWVNTYKRLDSLRNSTIWRTNSFEVVGTGATVKLAFVWRNDNALATNPGACVDNIYVREITDLNYFCDFTDANEVANWHIQNHTSCVNKWYIGSAAYESPNKGLYISNDGGISNDYSDNSGWVTAYREFLLPPGVVCDVAFDWSCFGEADYDYLMCCWVTDTTVNISSNANTSLPTWANSSARSFGANNSRQLCGGLQWKHEVFQVQGTGAPTKLVFVWMNNANTHRIPPAAVDNIQISRRDCLPPSDLTATVTGSDINVTWTGDATTYDVWYRNSYTNDPWTKIPGVTGNSYTIQNVTKGRYDVWVRSDCGNGEYSMWAETLNHLVVSGDGCINYTDLHNSQVVTCYYGSFANPRQTVGIVDNGYAAQSSRHTVHYIPELDPNTNGGLRTVPNGELASVRLGNWATGAQAESLVYNFTVDSLNSILMLQYAVVLEDPSHSSSEQPRFTIEILNQNNQLIDPTCGAADFIPGTNTTDWNNVNGSVRWKDWTLMGLNLQNLMGQNIKIRLTTYDCSQSGHYGYAYFLLNCASGEVKGLSCGTEAIDEVTAPDGFDYEWYRLFDPNHTVVSTAQTFRPGAGDTCTYICKCMYKGMHNCFFNLRISMAPRWPYAAATFTHTPADCKNKMTFTNQSTVKDVNGNLTGQDPEEYEWIVNGQTYTEMNPVVEFPDAGGNYLVKLIASMGGGACRDTAEFNLTVPAIASTTEVTTRSICQGQTFRWRGRDFTETCHVEDTIPQVSGCDSILILDLTVNEVLRTEVDTIICEGSVMDFHGTQYTTTGTYTWNGTTAAGCDSIVTLNLVVNPATNVTINDLSMICADDESFTVSFVDRGSVTPTDYRIEFGTKGKAQGFDNFAGQLEDGSSIEVPMPQPLMPGVYDATLILWDSVYHCGETMVPFEYTVLIPDSVVIQKFGNVLSLKNAQHNGGLTFKNYQWYVNGSAIPGATGSYYYLGEGNTFNFGDTYQVLVTLSDGTQLFTCPVTPRAALPSITAYPSVITYGAPVTINVPSVGNAKLWTVTGILLKSQPMTEGQNTMIAPVKEGMYLLDVTTEAGEKETFRLVVK